MKKLGLLLMSVAFFAQGAAWADEGQLDSQSEAALSNERIYPIYVGPGRRGRDRCFSYQGRDVVVEGDMVLRVYRVSFWSNGNCDLYY